MNYDKHFSMFHQAVTSAKVGEPITIKVKVSAPAGVKWVRLRYRNVNQEQDYQTMPLLATGEKETYQAVVPPSQINPDWDFMYYLQVMDNKSNGRIYPDLNRETPYIITKLKR
jgi:hypothetical protein